LMLITVYNRGPEAATMHLLPQLWFRNTWAWNNSPKPTLHVAPDGAIAASHAELGTYFLYADGTPALLFCENETNVRRLYGSNDAPGHFKDAFHAYVVAGDHDAVNPRRTGTKAAAHYETTVPAGGAVRVRLRLSNQASGKPFQDFEKIVEQRRREADAFYDSV